MYVLTFSLLLCLIVTQYIGLIAGDLLGVTGDGVYNLAEKNLVDLLEEKVLGKVVS